MGITGLLPFVKNSCRPANIKDFSGSTVAVDAYSWLHKGAFSCAEKLVKGEKTDGYVFYCMKQLNLLLEAGLRPIMVFDGCNLCSKEVTEKKRRANREKTRQRGKELLCEGKLKEARECFQRCVDVTPEMAREVIEACRKKSIDCIVAPYEADAQLAYLDKIGMAQLIITEDSDLILFGCSKVFFKMDSCGGGLIFEKENLSKSFGNKALKFSFEKFRYMCILSGCDYLPSLHGIGLAKACKFFTLTNNTDLNVVLSKLPSYLKMPRLVVPNTYVESFIKANNTFLYQLVFCPQKKGLVPLNPYPEEVKSEEMEYAGKYLPDELACQLAKGDINVKTMKKFEVSWSDPPTINEEKSFLWGSQGSSSGIKPSPKVEGFKFSTPKQKATASQKRQFSEIVKTEGEATCTDEELFSMYGSKDVKKSRIDWDPNEEDPIAEELTSSSTKMAAYKIKTPPKMHPKILNLPFRKIVRSRFFSSETTPIKNLNSSSTNVCSPEVENHTDSSLLSNNESLESTSSPALMNNSIVGANKYESSVSFDLETIDSNKPSTSDFVGNEDRCEFTIDFEKSSPKKDNKENIVHRFAKKKVPQVLDVSHQSLNCEDSIPNKQKNESWLDIIDEECNAATSTVSSNGKTSKLLDVQKDKFTKPAFLNNPLKKNTTKKLITKKLQDFKWTKESSKAKLNLSLGSDGTSCDESFDLTQETEKSASPSQDSEISPYFFSNSGTSSECAIDLVSDPEDTDACERAVKVELSENLVNNQSKTVLNNPKALKPLNNKSNKPGKCRTLGLSKNRKGCDKVSRKETLLNFNFIRQTKKEIQTVS